jgi:hypothetical protein
MNYQIMTEEQKQGDKYFPNYDELIKNATCEEEKQYLNEVSKSNIPFAFNMVYVTKQACGHFEIFQTPQNEYYTLEEVTKRAEETAKTRKCTRCICNW